MEKYLPRIADKILANELRAMGAVLIQGPKQCGKTTTAKNIAKSFIQIDDPLEYSQNIQMSNLNPYKLLEGDTPRLLDEWQVAPRLWDAVRIEVDNRGKFGQFILTGSSVPPKDSPIYHSGAGRISKITMEPMTLFESGESNGSVSFDDIFSGRDDVDGTSNLDLDELVFLTCRGGWPLSIGLEGDAAFLRVRRYVDSIISSDISMSDGVTRNPSRVKRFLKAYSKALSTETSKTCLLKDMREDADNPDDTVSMATVDSYLAALKDIFVVTELEAWNPDIRSKIAIRTTPTRHFTDPSIATAALGLGPQDLINDLESFGYFFESLCVRDLRVYAQALDADLYHYRDGKNLEADAVIHRRNGKWGAIEVKLGLNEVDDAASNLLKLKDRVDCNKMKEPSFLMVITGTSRYAYKRPDGVLVVPIGCLKP